MLDRLTFGIELEFICLRPETLFDSARGEAPYRGCDEDDIGAGPAIWEALLRKGIPAVGWEPLDTMDRHVPSYTRWRVETDSLQLSDEEEKILPDGYLAESVEMSSRKLRFNADNWRNEVAAVLQVLRDVEARGCRFITNASSGFHVHIGMDNGEFIPLRLAKDVLQMCTAFERLIDELHSSERIALPETFAERHVYYPLSFFHTFGKDFDPEKGTRSSFLLDRLYKIEEARTYEELGSFFEILRPEIGLDEQTSGHNCTVNIDNLYPNKELDRHAENLTGTIEFRQHAGTLDYLEIVAYVILISRLVIFASTAAPSDILDLIIRGVDPAFKLEGLLAAIECPEDVQDHFRKKDIVGVVSQSAQLSVGRIETPVDALIEQNDHECEQRASNAAVRAAIDKKYNSGLYGIDPEIKVSLPNSIAAPELEKALAAAQLSSLDGNSEEGESAARAQVLLQFAQSYQDGNIWFGRSA